MSYLLTRKKVLKFIIDIETEFKMRIILSIVLIFPILLLLGCENTPQIEQKQASEDSALGKLLYVSNCLVCHGENAKGSSDGPPLVHKYYASSHHADFSFYRAISSGVQSHHWSYGNMPAQPQVLQSEIKHIIAYIRNEQRVAGIK